MKSAQELFDLLNMQDETTDLEAKGASEVGRTVLETVCAFANEPDLGGGYILIGATRNDSLLFPAYTAEHILDPDKMQSDLATQCNTMFNMPIRPRMKIEQINNLNVLVVWIEELSATQKPLYFKNEALPKAAYRRIGPTDHRCSEDDLRIFYSDTDTYDRTILTRTSLADLDEDALNQYRNLRSRVNSSAEELTYENEDLLISLGCLDPINKVRFTVAGLLLFGTRAAQRRELSMLRADYIRIPGIDWVENPNDRFRTIDMRGPLISLLFRLVEAVNSDLPKAFVLAEGDLQADASGLPTKALREAIVNALMHRNYRENSPIQVLRYDNRLEIRNPGYSLKSEDQFYTPGSKTRNPVIAAVFHETNLAETKGSGIRAMRKLLQDAHLAPPTFESDREANSFTSRLLLHHFLNAEDFEWLQQFAPHNLSDNQKRGLIMVRELGAIDNLSYRQITDLDTLKASNELRQMRDLGIIDLKGKGRATYYVLSRIIQEYHSPLPKDLDYLIAEPQAANTEPSTANTEPQALNTEPQALNTEPSTANTEPQALNTEPQTPKTEAKGAVSINENFKILLGTLPKALQIKVQSLKNRENDAKKVSQLIIEMCRSKAFKLSELSQLLKRDENYLSRKFIKTLLEDKDIAYLYPDMINHPEQAYKAI